MVSKKFSRWRVFRELCLLTASEIDAGLRASKLPTPTYHEQFAEFGTI